MQPPSSPLPPDAPAPQPPAPTGYGTMSLSPTFAAVAPPDAPAPQPPAPTGYGTMSLSPTFAAVAPQSPTAAVVAPHQAPQLGQQSPRQMLDSPRTTFLTPTSGSGLKQRIRELENIIESELKRLHREVYMYKNQKIVQSNSCDTLVDEAKKELIDHLERSKAELKQFFVQQRSENLRLYDLIKTLRNENAVLQQTQLQLQRRLQSLEEDLGQ